MDLTGKTVLVVGSGISGVAATELLKKKNVNVVLFDGNKELDLTALREKHPVFADVKIILGELTAEDRSGLDLVVLSPGVPTDLPMVEDLKKDGIPYITATHDVKNPRSGGVMRRLGMKYRYSYEERWQPKDLTVTFRMYQLNLDGNRDRVYRGYWDASDVHFVEKDV